jgi:Basic region leucine zipper
VEPTRPTEARQRRMELRRNGSSPKPSRDEIEDSEYCDESSASSESSTIQKKTTRKRKSPDEGDEKTPSISTTMDLSLIRGIKKQARYEPTVPMSSKAELAAWRKEARRIRNRESAAASRNKTRQRIEELEHDLSQVQKLYDAALERIAQLEAGGMKCNNETQSPSLPQKDTSKELAPWSPAQQHAAEVLASSLTYENSDVPVNVTLKEETDDRESTNTTTDLKPSTSGLVATLSHQNIMISRPTADCVVSIQQSLGNAPLH